MQQHIIVQGMTCNGCVASVRAKLEALNTVRSVDAIALETGEVVLQTVMPLTAEQLQNALPEKYTVTVQSAPTTLNDVSGSMSDGAAQSTMDTASVSKWRQLKPLFIILFYITAASLLINRHELQLSGFMYDYMGLFFIVFSFFKILDLKGFPQSFAMYDPLAKRVPFYGVVYPFIETALGLMFLLRWNIPIALLVTLLILGITTVGVTRSLLSKQTIRCACLGTVLNLPMTEATFIENAIMLVMAVAMLVPML